MPSRLMSNLESTVLSAISFHKGLPLGEKWPKAPKADGASQKPVSFSEWNWKDSILYAHSARAVVEIESEGKMRG